jgi:hypothetical protein
MSEGEPRVDPGFEKLGVFYLGRTVPDGSAAPELLLYDAKDLTTHALVVGMTGSGKTGLCIDLLEEAALDGVPALVIDPKGDVPNLLLTFPELRDEDFAAWIDPADAQRAGLGVAEHAAATARRWREGLAAWGQDGARIARLRAATDLAIYTPGSSAGLQLSVLRSFAVPAEAVMRDPDALGDRVAGTVDGLLALLGTSAEPMQSREHILLSSLLAHAWRQGESLDLGALIRGILQPPFAQLGVLDLETFYPASERQALALRLNGLLASPGFAAWLEGEPLDAGGLLFTPEGKPRISILSIAHLSDAERMFVVTLVLNEVIAWMRAQSGTSSLRALLYMDEIFGFFPPVAAPPSKRPMLTLLKQARAHGLGVVLATQNPVDLDYKGLANCGTWFIGRLQTERDRARVLDGLEGAASASGRALERAHLERLVTSLGKRVFLMHNVHEQAPVLFETRWAMSYLGGPLTRAQIERLMAGRKPARAPVAQTSTGGAPQEGHSAMSARPVAPESVTEGFAALVVQPAAGATVFYLPALLGRAHLHFKQRGAKGLDVWRETAVLLTIGDDARLDWGAAREVIAALPALAPEPLEGARFAPLPPALARAGAWRGLDGKLARELYRSSRLRRLRYAPLELESELGEERSAFRQRVAILLSERRDREVEKIRQRYAGELQKLDERIRVASERLDTERAQVQEKRWSAAATVGASVLGALLGRKRISVSNVSRAGSAARAVGRTRKEQDDVERVEDRVEALVARRQELEKEAQAAIDTLVRELPASGEPSFEETEIAPLKSDITIDEIRLLWRPGTREAAGGWQPLDGLS